MKNNIVLILTKHHPILIDSLIHKGYEPIVYLQKPLDELTHDFRNKVIGIVTSNSCYMPASNIDLFPNLSFIGRLGSGMEIIDVEYAAKKSILCIGSPEGNANAVAEHALGLLLNLLNNISKSNNELKEGIFDRVGNMGHELSDLTIGIIGYGTNGSQFAHYLAMFGAKLRLFDKEPKKYPIHENIEFSTDYKHIIEACNCISFHLPIDNHAIDTAQQIIENMENPYYLLNIARGGLINLAQLYQNLQSGKVLGAALDVWPEEPISGMNTEDQHIAHALLNHPKFIGTPHIAGYTHQAFYKMSKIIGDKIPNFNNNLDIM